MKVELHWKIQVVQQFELPDEVRCSIDTDVVELDKITKDMENELKGLNLNKIIVVRDVYHLGEKIPFDKDSVPAGILQYCIEGGNKYFFVGPELIDDSLTTIDLEGREGYLFWFGKRWVDWQYFYYGSE